MVDHVGVVAVLGGAVWLVALSVCDARTRRLPNVLTLPGAAVVVLGAVASGRAVPALAGAAALAALYLAVHLVSSRGMGAGDVKLALGVGALSGAFGPEVWLLAAFTAPVLTALLGLALRRRALPHGPSMCVATAVAVGLALI